MPAYDQDRFLRRAVGSLFAQTRCDWELVVVDDGSPDATRRAVAPYLDDARVRYERLPVNRGMGAALNHAMAVATAPLLAYLPCDDLYYAEHLERLAACFEDDEEEEVVLVSSGVQHHYNRSARGRIPGHPLQLVQVMHRRTPDRWLERGELVTDDLDRMLWDKVRSRGRTAETGVVSCEWTDHPDQRHKLLQEPEGGLNTYRARFQVPHPIRFHSTVGNAIDEVEHYRRFRERPDTAPAPDGLKILLVGELAYNPERVLALEERGHRLYGLWMGDPYWYNSVGPLPFGHVEDLPGRGWQEAVQRLQPDVVYALLNWQAVPFAHRVLEADLGIPFVWHFKEGPFICIEKGTWPQLVDLYDHADGVVHSSPEMGDWLATVVPSLAGADRLSLVLDGDLPKAEWLQGERSTRLSENDGEMHTVVPGRPIGLHPPDVAALAREGIHLHFYGDFTHGQWRQWTETARRLAPHHLHLHPQADQDSWVREFSQYDAGWLHFFESRNGGELRRANWDDLNYPARLATLAVSGVPVLQRDNTGSIAATQSLVRELGIGLEFGTVGELGQQLRDGDRMNAVRENVWRRRRELTFDFHVDRLVEFFRTVISSR
ncbi:MAG: glycosyltransferase family 2 protein [Actinobacteria bacterium]|nr:MAG: glycosyltransferase family 2 protein [Actinomycetota bacterium]